MIWIHISQPHEHEDIAGDKQYILTKVTIKIQHRQ